MITKVQIYKALLHEYSHMSFRAEKFVSTNFEVEKSCRFVSTSKISPLPHEWVRSFLAPVEMTHKTFSHNDIILQGELL